MKGKGMDKGWRELMDTLRSATKPMCNPMIENQATKE